MLAFSLVTIIIALFVGSLYGMAMLGRLVGNRHEAESLGNLGSARNISFSLFGLLLAFAFNSATDAFQARREMIRQEGLTIRSAYNLLPGLPSHFEEAIRPMFHSYADLRMQSYRPARTPASEAELRRQTDRVEDRIWASALKASLDPSTSELGPAFRLRVADMQRARVQEEFVSRSHLPWVAFAFLILISLYTSFYVGYGMAGNNRWSRLHLLAYAGLLGSILYLIMDFEYPDLGVIHADAPPQILSVREGEINLGEPLEFGGDSRAPENPDESLQPNQ